MLSIVCDEDRRIAVGDQITDEPSRRSGLEAEFQRTPAKHAALRFSLPVTARADDGAGAIIAASGFVCLIPSSLRSSLRTQLFSPAGPRCVNLSHARWRATSRLKTSLSFIPTAPSPSPRSRRSSPASTQRPRNHQPSRSTVDRGRLQRHFRRTIEHTATQSPT